MDGHISSRGRENEGSVDDEPYNILPLHDMLADHDALRFPEVRAAHAALQAVGDLSRPQGWRHGMDLLDWLGVLFGFQAGNVKNQREHLVLLLANDQMRIHPPPDPVDRMDARVVRKLRKKVLKNYVNWCSYLRKKSNLWLKNQVNEQRDLLYISLYLLIWGESANLRFMPECLCFIFHNMANELNRVLEHYIDDTGRPAQPAYTGSNAFLEKVVTPLYDIVRAEALACHEGKAPHSAWRNYDDMNEYFWSKRCFSQLSWPLNRSCSFMVDPSADRGKFFGQRRVGKTGFVEQRSFWNIYRSFHHLWTGYILLLQAMVILAFNSDSTPWKQLTERSVQAKLLTIFITWAGLRILQAVLDLVMQFRIISVGNILTGLRMVLKIVVASGWTVVFVVLYIRMWNQRNSVGSWSGRARTAFLQFLEAAAVFIIPEVLALTSFVLPWIRILVEQSEWKFFHILTWWFQARWFVARGLREGVWDNFKYTSFWFLVLLTKIAFSYFLQIKPLVDPTRELLDLKNVDYAWHEFWSGSNRFSVLVLWAPVVLIYFMDTQIWYTVFSSLIGALVGLFAHLGEIRNLPQLKLRFPFFASAVFFNLMPEDSYITARPWGNVSKSIKDVWHRVKLRYGFGTIYRKLEPGSLEAGKFAYLWNSIMENFREEDIISDKELELLEIPAPAWNISVVQWPSVLLSNELQLALRQAQAWTGKDDKRLWRKVCRSEYRRCAVIECFESTKHVLMRIVKLKTREYEIIDNILSDINSSLASYRFLENYAVRELPEVHARVLALVTILEKKPVDEDIPALVQALQNLFEVVVRDLQLEKEDSMSARVTTGLASELLFLDAIELPHHDDEAFFRQLRRFKTTLSTREAMNNIPRNLEARRRIAFFSNSLFMKMPHAPPVEKMLAFSVLTPYYSEDVMYSREKLLAQNEDGISILYYLNKIYPDEWENFMERMRREEGIKDIKDLWSLEKALQLRLWASYRGQTLARTVRGMTYYHKALQMLSYLDGVSEVDMRQGIELMTASVRGGRTNSIASAEINSNGSQRLSLGSSGRSNTGELFKKSQQQATASMKFTYVVTCQIYGAQKAKKEVQAEDILYLLQKHEALRVAYVDEVATGNGKKYYSVLVKYDDIMEKEVEIYRVQLPGPLKLGEGKPENQNHAIIFTRGDAVQTIDMNQDNYFEEALKARNLLQEFTRKYGIRRPQILGVREHIFTGSVSSLAWFMSAQETSFVTLGQRVLANPLKIRMHYGHPDVFDRLWFITRGGISKASRVINISEDIFAGFNCTLRGGNVTHHEYIQVGKGRDVGLNQTALFEAKVASGNGEQILSRDVYRLGHHLDFFRMLSFYYTTVGFFISNMMVVLTVYAFLWGRAYLALSGLENAASGTLASGALTASINQQFIVQLGIFTALPMIVENTIEHGFASSVWDFLTMQLQLSSVFFTFSLGTRAHFFGRTVLHGGAKYRATGRGFVVVHEKFAHIYRLFSRSHFVKAIELILLLIVYMSFSSVGKSTTSYILITFSSWFLALSWILAPFLFNPSGFDWLKTVEDFEDFLDWIWYRGGISVKSDQSWEVWWNEEQEHLRSTGFWGKVLEIVLSLRFFVFQYGVVYHMHIAADSTSILVYLLSWICVAGSLFIYIVLMLAANRYSMNNHIYFRAIQALVIFLMVLLIVVLVEFTSFQILDVLLSILAFVPTGWGFLSIALVFRHFLERLKLWPLVISVARMYELGFGVIVFTPVAVLSWLPGFQSMQTRILFNEAFSRGLHISRILVGKRPNPGF
ncbi:hypothetical protein KP509_09G062400 [Ceratopteris richardii]|uniref:1,3-beta-glucan synthase n=1 Tax=Ceratopteris richardii TaxID=49495 RepID=A0A8T2U4T9_CERRI|nr:hypothetical protein KP509_09G062400 [Ceratopteris richardii]